MKAVANWVWTMEPFWFTFILVPCQIFSSSIPVELESPQIHRTYFNTFNSNTDLHHKFKSSILDSIFLLYTYFLYDSIWDSSQTIFFSLINRRPLIGMSCAESNGPKGSSYNNTSSLYGLWFYHSRPHISTSD